MTGGKGHGQKIRELLPDLKAKPVEEKTPPDTLKDSVIYYKEPTQPVAEDDWENA